MVVCGRIPSAEPAARIMNTDSEPVFFTLHLHSDRATLRLGRDTMLHGILNQRFDGERGYSFS
jgi:hypothetical protein